MKKLPILLSFVIMSITLNAQDFFGNSTTQPVTSSKTTYSYTVIDNPELNNNPGAVFFVSRTQDNRALETSPARIWYDGSTNKWTLYDESAVDKKNSNSTYHVFIPSPGTTYFNMLLSIPFISPVVKTGC